MSVLAQCCLELSQAGRYSSHGTWRRGAILVDVIDRGAVQAVVHGDGIRHSVAKNHWRRGAILVDVIDRGAVQVVVLSRKISF